MAAPQIRRRESNDLHGLFTGRGVETFVVVSEGSFGGRELSVGDVLVCRGEAGPGDDTVLVATGLGRPRLGSRRGGRWYGDVGEPCAEERWRSAGKLVACCRWTRSGWVAELTDPRAATVPQAEPAVSAGQLSLFAA